LPPGFSLRMSKREVKIYCPKCMLATGPVVTLAMRLPVRLGTLLTPEVCAPIAESLEYMCLACELLVAPSRLVPRSAQHEFSNVELFPEKELHLMRVEVLNTGTELLLGSVPTPIPASCRSALAARHPADAR